MKTIGLLFMVFGLTMAGIFAGKFAQSKQSGMFPPGDNNPETRSAQKSAQVTWPESAQNAPISAQAGDTGTMPDVSAEYPSANEVVLAGCLLNQAGSLVLQRNNEHPYQLAGDLSSLQPSVGKWVQVAGHAQEQMPQAEFANSGSIPTQFVVQQLQQTGPVCNPILPTTVAVSGEAGNEGYAAPISTTKSLRQPTSGTLTETGELQAPGKHIGKAEQQTLPVQQQPSVLQGVPPDQGRVGDSPFSAEQASKAVHTAEAAARAASGGGMNATQPNEQPNREQQIQQQESQRLRNQPTQTRGKTNEQPNQGQRVLQGPAGRNVPQPQP
jgi:hypothetical protein